MNCASRLLWYTLVVSFFGSLPLGTLNISITNLVLDSGAGAAFTFGLGAIFIELLLVRLAVEGLARLQRFKHYYIFFQWVAFFVLLCFAAVSIIAALQMKNFAASLPFVNKNPFFSGVLLSVLNPLHLPYWLGWTAAFQSKGILSTSKPEYNLFVMAIGAGTAVAFLLYGWIGRVLILLLAEKQFILNWCVGLTLLMTAVWQVQKVLRKNSKRVLLPAREERRRTAFPAISINKTNNDETTESL